MIVMQNGWRESVFTEAIAPEANKEAARYVSEQFRRPVTFVFSHSQAYS